MKISVSVYRVNCKIIIVKILASIKDISKHRKHTHTARSFMLWVISGGACPPCMVAFGRLIARLPCNWATGGYAAVMV